MSKSLKRRALETLDRPGGRWLLSAVTTRHGRRLTGKDATALYDDIWVHRVGAPYLADSPKFRYYDADVLAWEAGVDRREREAADYWFHRYEPRHGDVIVDVSAGMGTDLTTFSRAVGSHGTVVAIEAHPTTFLGLTKTCKWNRLDNVECIDTACMDKDGVVHIGDETDSEANAIAASGIPVRGAMLDRLLEEIELEGEIALLKMNIEGADRFALPGMEQTLRRTTRVAIVCFRTWRGEGPSSATFDFTCGFLRSRGFDLEVRSNDPRPYVQDHAHGRRADATASARR